MADKAGSYHIQGWIQRFFCFLDANNLLSSEPMWGTTMVDPKWKILSFWDPRIPENDFPNTVFMLSKS